MARELFINQWFTDAMCEAGERLITKLDESNAQVVAAFWFLEPEKNWELNIVSPLVGSEGPRKYYKRINDVYDGLSDDESIVSLHDIRVSNIHNRVVDALKHSVLYKANLKNNRLGRNFIDGFYIEDMYLYRIEWDMLSKLSNLNQVA
ncbi:hypothetical protein [Methylomonas sp. TEB]|uniref:hypothetical protein n=1 Tax=Methylomonas sp. TEB TaxID=3398229 RepID=UPI0039F4D6D3